MDPASIRVNNDPLPLQEMVQNPPKGANLVEWYEFMGAMVAWDVARSIFTAWLTKYWIDQRPKQEMIKPDCQKNCKCGQPKE